MAPLFESRIPLRQCRRLPAVVSADCQVLDPDTCLHSYPQLFCSCHAPFRRPSQYLLNFELSKRASVFNLWYHRGAEGAASGLRVDWAAVRSLGLPDPWPRASVWQFCVSCTCVRMAINAAFKDFAVWAAGTSIGERAKQCHIQVHLSSNNFCGEQRQKPINEHTTTTACILSAVAGVCVSFNQSCI